MDTVAGSAGSLASSVASWSSEHEDGLIALALLCATCVTFAGRTLLRPTVFLLGFIPASVFVCNIGLSLFPGAASDDAAAATSAAAEGAAETAKATPASTAFPGIVIAASVVVGIVAGTIMLRLLFMLATFAITAASGAVLVLIVHVLLLQPDTKSGEVVLFTVAVAAALVTGMLSLAYPKRMIIFGTAFDGAAIAIFALAHFLGNEPDILGTVTSEKSVLWSVGYAIASIVLGLYGTYIQIRVARAEKPLLPVRNADAEQDAAAEALLGSYGAVENDFPKTGLDGLGAPPLYEAGEMNKI